MLNEDKEKAIQYLFGELNEADRDTLEERIFSDEDFSLFLEATEKDLIDEYVRHEMNPAERERFEKKYLITERRREQIRIAAILQEEVFAEKENLTPIITEEKTSFWEALIGFFEIPNLAWTGGLAILLLGILVVSLLIIRQNNKSDDFVKDNNSNIKIESPSASPKVSPDENVNNSPNENLNKNGNSNQLKNANQIEIKKPEKKPTPSPAPNDKSDSPQSEPSIFIASLLPPLRSGTNPVLKIPNSAKTVRLQLFDNFGQKYEKFIVELNDTNGNSVWSQEIRAGKGAKSITVNIPNSLFKAGNQEIAVRGKTADGNVEEFNFYNFTVQRK